MSRNKRKAAEETAAATGTDGSRRTRSRRGKAEDGEEDVTEDKATAAVAADGDEKEEEEEDAPTSDEAAAGSGTDGDAEAEAEVSANDVEEKVNDDDGGEKVGDGPAKEVENEEGPVKEVDKDEGPVKEKEKEDVTVKEVDTSEDTGAATAAVSAKAPDKVKDVPPPKPSTPAETAYWNQMFFQLMLYRVHHGNVNVKSTDEKHRELYKWIVQLRKDYKIRERSPDASPLTPDQISVLESVRFAFTTRGEEHWQKSYEKLKEYKDEHGHVLVPRQCEIPGLGDWVTSQRQQYQDYKEGKPTPLTKQRKDLLDDIGFQWRVRNRPEWTSKFEELLTYKAKHGDTRVPQHYAPNKALGKWVAKQREQFKLLKKGKHSFLTPDRLEKLNGIDFAWAVRGDTPDDAGNPDGATVTVAVEGEGEVVLKEEDEEETKEEGETKPKPEVKKEDEEVPEETKVDAVTV